MSTKKSTERRTAGSGERLAKAFGTTKPARIAEKLHVTYQAAKNYLQGRVPETKVLIQISDSTGYSIHWLLTGEGPEIVVAAPLFKLDSEEDQRRREEEFRAQIRAIVMDVIQELILSSKLSAKDREYADSLLEAIGQSKTQRKGVAIK